MGKRAKHRATARPQTRKQLATRQPLNSAGATGAGPRIMNNCISNVGTMQNVCVNDSRVIIRFCDLLAAKDVQINALMGIVAEQTDQIRKLKTLIQFSESETTQTALTTEL